jgi:predicted house-cleaning NTP pyrophosphatase (Maf/HAM1 superfamily)
LDVATVHFNAIPGEAVEALIADGSMNSCAGGLQVEHPLAAPYVRSIDGCITSVQGLGVELLTRLLLEAAALSE